MTQLIAQAGLSEEELNELTDQIDKSSNTTIGRYTNFAKSLRNIIEENAARQQALAHPIPNVPIPEVKVSAEGDLTSVRSSNDELAQALVENLVKDVPELSVPEAQSHATNIIDSTAQDLAVQAPAQKEQDPAVQAPAQKEQDPAVQEPAQKEQDPAVQAPALAQVPDFNKLNKDQLVDYAKNNHPDIKTPHSFKEENLRQKLKDESAKGFKKLKSKKQKSKSISGKGLSQYPIKAVAGALHKHYQKKVRNLRNIHDRKTENQEYRTNLIKQARK